MSKRRLDIVGAGRVGKTLARLWKEQAAFEIGDVVNRSPESSKQAIAFIGGGTVGQIDQIDVLMISTSDSALADCAAALAKTASIGPESVVFHCSGSISSEILAPLRARGASIASMHPVKSFAGESLAVESFPAHSAHSKEIQPLYKFSRKPWTRLVERNSPSTLQPKPCITRGASSRITIS